VSNHDVTEAVAPKPPQTWDSTVDFLIVGSGAGGMTAAITAHTEGLSTLVIEKSDKYGGTTALSGGVIWIPNNHHMSRTSIDDSSEDGLAYLEQVVSADVPRENLQAYVQRAPEMLRFIEANSLLKYDPAPEYPDYYSELKGGKLGARSLDPKPYSIYRLGVDLARQMRRTEWAKRESFAMTAAEAHIVFSFDYRAPLIIFKRLFQYWLDLPSRLRKLPDARLTLGKALVGRLRKSLAQKNIPLWLNTQLIDLYIEDGNIVGVSCDKAGKPYSIKVNKGVLMASGGFAHHAGLRAKHHPHPDVSQWTAASRTDTGDGILAGQKIGAKLDMMNYAWWTPTMRDDEGNIEAFIVGKSMPNGLMVNQAGKRFCNEAEPYEDFVKHQFASHQTINSIPAFFVFDSRFRKEFPLGLMLPPGKYLPDSTPKVKALLDNGWLKKADTLEALAEQCGIDKAGLTAEIAKFRGFAKNGVDEDFNKGQSPNDLYYSDHRINPNPCLAFEEQGPFYAVNIYPGDLGTKGGLSINPDAQVVNENNQPIKGLYACGNASASVMGDSYPGAGSTIGPAMTFAYVAAKHAANTLK